MLVLFWLLRPTSNSLTSNSNQLGYPTQPIVWFIFEMIDLNETLFDQYYKENYFLA